MWPALSVVCIVMAAAFLIGRRARIADKPVSAALILAAAFAPVVLILLSLMGGGGRLGAPRLAITDVAMDGAALAQDQGLSVGGDPVRDDLVLPGLPSQLIQVRRTGGVATASFAAAAPGPAATVAEVDGGAPLVGARPFGLGDQVCVAGCAATGARWYQLDPSGDGLAIVGAPGVGLPKLTRRSFPDIPYISLSQGALDWGAAQRIYPLRSFGFELGRAGERAVACRTRYVCGADGAPVKSFLFRPGGWWFQGGGRLWIMLLDPGASVRGPDGAATAGPASLPIGPRGLKVSLYSVHYDEPDWSKDPEHLADASRIVPAGDLTLTADAEGAAVRLGAPAVREIDRDDLQAAGQLTGSASLDLYGAGVGAGAGGDPLVLDRLGGALAGNLRSQLRFDGSDDFGRKDHLFSFDADGAEVTQPFGSTVRIGAGAPRGGTASAGLRVGAIAFPWLMILLPLGWAALSAWAHMDRWRTDAVGWTIESLAQLLLALRWLVALEGAFLDPQVDAASLLGAGALAYLAGPMLLAAIALRPADAPRRWPRLFPFAGLALAATWIAYGRPDGISLGFLAVAAAALILSDEAGPRGWLAARLAWPSRGVWGVIRAVAGAPPIRWLTRRPGQSRASTRWLTLAVLLRIGLLIGGVKERISFPAHLAVTTIYLPLLLVGFAHLFTEPPREGERDWSRPLRFWIWLALTYGLLPSAARDHGFSLTLTLPVALCGAAIWLRSRPPQPPVTGAWALTGMWALPTAAICAAFAAVLLVWPIFNAGLQGQMAAAVAAHDTPRAEATLRNIAQNNDNTLRLEMIAYPQGLEAAGTLGAEQVSILGEQLSQYTGALFGHGYLTPSKMADEIRPVQMTDNVSAIHLMAPFGRLGAALLLVLLGISAVCCAGLSQPGPHPERRALGLLALWSLFGAAAYMVLANLQLTPFTGRNVYLLAANSHSDLIEGLALLALAQFGLAEERR